MSNHFSAANLQHPGDDARLDLTDLFVIAAPGNPGRTVLIMESNPFTKGDGLHPDAVYAREDLRCRGRTARWPRRRQARTALRPRNAVRPGVAAGRQSPAPQQHGRALPQLQRGQHRLVVLFLVLNGHARREQPAGRSVLDQVKETRPRTSWS
jgi:hypothetical protein